jgi:biotin carboxyl carrier protein
MSEQWKVSGKRVSLPKAAGGWTFLPRPGPWLIAERRRDDGTVERRRIAVAQARGKLSAHVDGAEWFGDVSSVSGRGAATGGSEADLTAQFPGKVRKLLVKAGEVVAEGQPLLMVEAMKMEFPVKAPFAGEVTQVHVAEGQQLAPGQKFLDLTPSG